MQHKYHDAYCDTYVLYVTKVHRCRRNVFGHKIVIVSSTELPLVVPV